MQIFSPIQIVEITAFGVNGTGTSTTFAMAGVKAGDVLLSADHISPGKPEPIGYNATGVFRSVVAQDGLMQQNGGGSFADNEFVFRFLRLNQIS